MNELSGLCCLFTTFDLSVGTIVAPFRCSVVMVSRQFETWICNGLQIVVLVMAFILDPSFEY